MALAHALPRRRAGRPGTLPALAVAADGRHQRVEGDVHRDVLAGRGEAPLLHRLDERIAHRADVAIPLDHRALLADMPHMGQPAARLPDRKADVDGALIGPNADPREEATVDVGVVAIEVIRLGPGGVALDRMGQVVAGVEDRAHRAGRVGAGNSPPAFMAPGPPGPAGGSALAPGSRPARAPRAA